MSVFVDSSHLGLLVVTSGVAAISGLVTTWSIREEDAGAAWIWASVFVAASFLAAFGFWRMV